MIDHMQDMVASSMALGADGNMNFQMASGAVEAGVKIYSSRVDSVATEAYKVLSNLSRANNKDGASACSACPAILPTGASPDSHEYACSLARWRGGRRRY
jgi:hypothetical protein